LQQLEEHKEHEEVKYEYKYIKGYLVMNKARAYFGQENYFKACNTIQSALKMGMKVDQKYIDICLKN